MAIIRIEEAGYNFERDLVYTGETAVTKEKTLFLMMGRGSYWVSGHIDAGNRYCHVIVGRYCSLASDIGMIIGLNHDYRKASTYPFREILERGDDACRAKNNKYQIVIGNDVWVGNSVNIMGGVHIGTGAVVGAGSLVTKDVPPYAIVGGVPAKIISYRFEESLRKDLLSTKWWLWEHDRIIERLDLLDNPYRFAEKFARDTHIRFSEDGRIYKELKNAGWKIFFLVEDNNSPAPVWKKAMDIFSNKFTINDKVMLVVAVSSGETGTIAKYIEDCSIRKGASNISICAEKGVPLDVLQEIDVFLTTREFNQLPYFDELWQLDKKIVFCLDPDAFE